MKNISSENEVARAWDIHKDADGVFYNHVNAYLPSQTFLVAGFVAVFVADLPPVFKLALSVGICLLALVFNHQLAARLKTTHDRLRFLKRKYLIQDNVYQNYLAGNDLREGLALGQRRATFDDKKKGRHELSETMPGAMMAFWLSALALELGFFIVSTAGET